MAGGSFYAPAFGRLFSRLSVTPASVTAATALVAVSTYASAAQANSNTGAVVLMMGVFVALVLAANPPGVFVWGVAPPLMLFACMMVHPHAVVGVLVGIGMALPAVGWARSFIDRDHAFDNFDRLLAVCVGAVTWSALGASTASWLTSGSFPPVSVLGAAVLGLLLSAVVLSGDVRRLRWLRRVRAGELPYAIVASTEAGVSTDVPALIGGWTRSDAVLALRQTLENSAFRSGFRELAVARVPADLRRASRAVWLRLIGVGLSAGLLLALATGTLLGP